ncbi:hypothetical protein TKK_0001457 [Trichogramma kaykai]
MPRKRKLSDWSRRCRFCLSLEPSSSELFVDNLGDAVKDVAKCTDIEIIQEPSYPNKICYACHYKLNMWTEFKTKFINSHKSIISYLNLMNQNEESKIEEGVINLSENAAETSPAKSQSHPYDSSTSVRKLTRSRKQKQHERFAKRWVQRKNALKVARGEKSSESDSEDNSNLSPIQKVQRDLGKKKCVEKALKNLETDLTDKYKLTYIDDGNGKPIRRTRKVRVGESIYRWQTVEWLSKWINKKPDDEKQALLEQDEKTKIEMIEKVMGKSIHEIDTEYIREFEKANNVQLLEPSVPIASTKYVDYEESSIPDNTKKYTSDDPDPYVPMSLKKLKLSISKDNTIPHNSDINDKPKEIENNPKNDLNIISEQVIVPKKPPFKPQTVTVELSIGNATYIVKTKLDLPSSIEENAVNNNLKSNGLSAASSGKVDDKNDVMNAVQLQRIKPNEENSKEVKQPSEKMESQRCLKVEVEGLEAQALQRVQLSLANFVTNEIPDLLTNQSSSLNKKLKKPKFRDSYESLEYQLRSIVERVLRSNYQIEQDLAIKNELTKKLIPSNTTNAKLNVLEYESSSLQPTVLIKKLNIDQIQKKYSINNLKVLQNNKIDKDDSSPLINRKPGKRKLVMPRKFDDFSVNLPPGSDDDIRRPKKSTPDDGYRKRRKSMAEDIKKIKKESQSNLILGSLILDPDSNIESSNDGHVEVDTIRNVILSNKDTLYLKSTDKYSSKSLEYTQIIENMSPTEMSSTEIEVLEPLQKPLPSFGRITKRVDKTANSTTKKPKLSKDSSRHLCGICSKEFLTNEAAQVHMIQHANDPNVSRTLSLPKTIGRPKSVNSSTLKPNLTKGSTGKTIMSPMRTMNKQSPVNRKINSPKSLTNGDNKSCTLSKMQTKAKLMRCKRCQAIVEARHVKSHVCNSVKYNCNRCECSFGAEHLLVAHLDTHKERAAALELEQKLAEELKRKKSQLTEKTSTHVSSETEMFSCFVCEKIFVDEVQMKDHLQMHCDETSEEANEKGFQCAFCCEKFQTEESLETHVGNHLLEDGDEKISMLINPEMKRSEEEKDSSNSYKCELCDAEFTTSHFLSMHVAEHEEQEEHIALEQEFVCSICDEVFDSPDELNEHQEVHTSNSHVCMLCEKTFATIEELQVHVSTHQ